MPKYILRMKTYNTIVATLIFVGCSMRTQAQSNNILCDDVKSLAAIDDKEILTSRLKDGHTINSINPSCPADHSNSCGLSNKLQPKLKEGRNSIATAVVSDSLISLKFSRTDEVQDSVEFLKSIYDLSTLNLQNENYNIPLNTNSKCTILLNDFAISPNGNMLCFTIRNEAESSIGLSKYKTVVYDFDQKKIVIEIKSSKSAFFNQEGKIVLIDETGLSILGLEPFETNRVVSVKDSYLIDQMFYVKPLDRVVIRIYKGVFHDCKEYYIDLNNPKIRRLK